MSTRRSSTGASGSSRKRRLSTPRSVDTTDEPTAPAAAAGTVTTAAKSRGKKSVAASSSGASKSTDDGFEFIAKKPKKADATSTSASAAAAASSSSSAATPVPAASSSSSSSSAPSLSAPAYPSQNLRSSQKFTAFSISAPLAQGVTDLCREVFEREQGFVQTTFGHGAKSKYAAKGQLAFLPTACQNMADEVLRNMPTKLQEYLQSEEGKAAMEDVSGSSSTGSLKPTVLENSSNVAQRDAIERWTRLKKQAEADTEVFRKERQRREVELAKVGKQVPKIVGVLSGEDQAFIASHAGGLLSAAISRCYASAAIKGDATLHGLEQIDAYIATVQQDQQLMAKRINAEEKKAYGTGIEDPKSLIQMITAGPSTTTASAATTEVAPMEQ